MSISPKIPNNTTTTHTDTKMNNTTRKPMPNMVRRVMCPQGARVVMVQQPSGYHIKPKQPIVMQRSKGLFIVVHDP